MIATSKRDSLPHRNLYTRIQVSPSNGVGVFAIRDIPEGTRLFVGDIGETKLVSIEDVEAIAEPEIRRMYIDFCPVVDGYFVAPADFNQITMGWYMNHSEEPNVAVLGDLQFVTSRFIARGEELVTDYTMYSDHASAYVRPWTSCRE
jgi:hypothetical protein